MALTKTLPFTVSKVAVITGLSALVLFGGDLLVASRLAMSADADAYFVASTVSRTLYALSSVIGGALVPVFVATGRSIGETERLYASVFNIILFVLFTLTILGQIFAPSVVNITSPGLNYSTAQRTSLLLRITFPSGLFSGLGAVLVGMLNARERFTAAAWSSFVRAIGTVGGMVLLSGYGAAGLSAGWTLGGILHLVLTLGICQHLKVFRYKVSVDWHNPALPGAARLAGAALWGAGIEQLVLILEQALASFLPSGTISVLNYATRVVRVGGGLVVLVIARVSLPTLVDSVEQGLPDKADQQFIRTLRFAAYLVFPITTIMAGLAQPISTILMRDAATVGQVSRLAIMLSLTSIWLIFQLLYQFSLMYLYAQRRIKSIALGYVVLICGFGLWGALIGRSWAGKGLALVYPLSLLFGAAYGLWALRLSGQYWRNVAAYAARLTLAAMLAGVSAYGVARLVPSLLAGWPSTLRAGFTLSLGSLIAGAMWLGTTALTKVPETRDGVRAVQIYLRSVRNRLLTLSSSVFR